jgi:hypothetical protein
MYNFFLEDIKNKVPSIELDGKITNYKQNIEFLSNFIFYQEEGIN